MLSDSLQKISSPEGRVINSALCYFGRSVRIGRSPEIILESCGIFSQVMTLAKNAPPLRSIELGREFGSQFTNCSKVFLQEFPFRWASARQCVCVSCIQLL